MTVPDRWLHLRHPLGFDDAKFVLFEAQCRIWQAYTSAVLAEWSHVEPRHRTIPAYVFFPPERSKDLLQVTLPLGGDRSLSSRAMFEDASSHLLSDFFPIEFRLQLEEGVTETTDLARGPTTSWRRVLRPDQLGR